MPTERSARIGTLVHVVTMRKRLLKAIWGPGGWPVLNRATLQRTFDARDPRQAAQLHRRGIPTQGAIRGTFVRAEELSVRVSLGGHNHETWAYHIFPSARPVNRLVVVHHGHGDSFQSGNPDYRLNEALAQFLGSGYAVLAMYMP